MITLSTETQLAALKTLKASCKLPNTLFRKQLSYSKTPLWDILFSKLKGEKEKEIMGKCREYQLWSGRVAHYKS